MCFRDLVFASVLLLIFCAVTRSEPRETVTLVKDIFVREGFPEGSSNPDSLEVLDGIVYFAATAYREGRQLWRSDGTESGTYPVVDTARADWVRDGVPYNPDHLTVWQNRLFFSAIDGQAGGDYRLEQDTQYGVELWVTDGAAWGTHLVADINPGRWDSSPHQLFAGIDRLYFLASGEGYPGIELWATDGTNRHTYLVKDIHSGNADANIDWLTRVGDAVFFVADSDFHGREIWVTDGTASGTQLVLDVNPGIFDANPRDLVNLNGILFFSAENQYGTRELWRSAGTAKTTRRVRRAYIQGWGNPHHLKPVDDRLFFAAYQEELGVELWQSQGSPQSTNLVKDIAPVGNSYPRLFMPVGERVYFWATDGMFGMELWCSDGTAEGTFLVKDINIGSAGSLPYPQKQNLSPENPDFHPRATEFYAVLNGILYFRAYDKIYGAEVWRTDGTLSGTYMVADINSGSASSNPSSFVVAEGRLFFRADDGVHGAELWMLTPP